MLDLFVLGANGQTRIPTVVNDATEQDFQKTVDWQTSWLSKDASALPNKVALHRADTGELLGLMSYLVDKVPLLTGGTFLLG